MLVQLSINGFALIDKLNMEFDPRFNVLTGETGAGKSIIIDAVSLLLGARAQNDLIRSNRDKALVEGVFMLSPNHPLESFLNENGFELDTDDRTLILSREITLSGKNSCRINNRIVTLSLFKEIGKQLVNIYGQHDFQSLSQNENHIFLLDSLADASFHNLLKIVDEKYNQWQMWQNKLDNMLTQTKEKAQRLDFLQFQVAEINDLKLAENEDEEINNELAILNNWEKICSTVNEGYELLYGQGSAYDKISKANHKLAEILRLDNSFRDILNNLETAVYYVEDAARTLKSYAENFNFDNERKEYLQERKFAIDKLKRKYGGTLKDILEFKNKADEEINELMNSEFLVEDLQKKVQKSKEDFYSLAERLSEERKKIAATLELKLQQELNQLAMPNTIFKVNIERTSAGNRGVDKIEFLISPNPGEPLRPLAKIASGGEMSRIMLAFKVIVAGSENLTTLIFDEIDTGIGGQVVIKVAEKLFEVAQNYQVLCVTHSPHIASFAHRHFKIFKTVNNGMTFTEVKTLEEEERILELARMLGGKEEITMDHALKMITKAKQKNKQNLN